jgi:hypothetical protein
VIVQPHATRPVSHGTGWVGFWLWAIVGAGLVFGLISFVIFFLIPPVAAALLLARRSRWTGGPVLLGLVAGAGVPLLVVAGVQWNAWHHRTGGDLTPDPYYWGAVGLCLLAAGVGVHAVLRRRNA